MGFEVLSKSAFFGMVSRQKIVNLRKNVRKSLVLHLLAVLKCYSKNKEYWFKMIGQKIGGKFTRFCYSLQRIKY